MKKEHDLSKHIRAAAPYYCMRLWRNNSGALFDSNGRLVRFGLGNDSKAINKVLKSSDLVGYRTITITKDMVGESVAVFTAIELKKLGGKRHPGQLNFINLVNEEGGRAAIVEDFRMFKNFIRGSR